MTAVDHKGALSEARRALIVHPYLKRHRPRPGATAAASAESRLEEAGGLALAIGLEVAGAEAAPLAAINPATYVGKGKASALAAMAEETGADVVVFDCALSPVQQRNLEREIGTKVIDRTGLILEIFGERAETREGVLQVELAHLEYQLGRLVRSWTHLERQRGGFGFLGGPGERQIEADRRAIRERIARIRKDLGRVAKTRTLQRTARQKVPYPTVALVGYTNAGKSTLFNRLTKADVTADARLFATLDPTLRAVILPSGRKGILSDTVGFISDLPTELVAAFRATLEEVTSADMILHIRDFADPERNSRKRDVESVLESLGITEGAIPVIECANKIDRLDADMLKHLKERAAGHRAFVAISATTGEGTDDLLQRIEEILVENEFTAEVTFPVVDGALRSWLYENAEVVEAIDEARLCRARISITKKRAGQLKALLKRKGVKKGGEKDGGEGYSFAVVSSAASSAASTPTSSASR